MADTSSTTAAQGQLLAGRYRLTGLIASGGMAQVWLATDEVLERQVAVKILHQHLAEDESFVARFRAEAVAAARLRHPSIVSIYDTCSDDGLQAIVMELIRGRNLRQQLDDGGALTPARVVAVGAQVADALATAHRSGIVHRDIKPANILLCEDDRVMVTDFGIAKLRGDRDLTQTGLLLGSVKYLSPEQVRGESLDGRSDIYSLSVVLYEAVCGRPPFTAETDAATALLRLQREPLLPRQIKASVPRGLENVIMRGMAQEVASRYPSAEEFRAALLAAPESGGDATRVTSPPPAPAPRPAPRPSAAPPARRRAAPPARHRAGRNWLVPTLVVILVTLSLVTAGLLLGRTEAGHDLLDRAREAVGQEAGGSGTDPSGDPVGDLVPLSAIHSFDPQSTGPPPGENDGELRFAVDGDATTAWETEGYNSRTMDPKSGVGVAFELDERAPLRELRIESSTTDWAARVYVADGVGDTLEDWGEPVDDASGIDGSYVFDLDDTEGSAVLLWYTDLGAGDTRQRVHAGITEASVWS